ncbi:YtxH domain-containing protein [Patescibacteria group bacterium]|nr:YtxH domain-containing protein [Patescibacteria group bacterium]
MFGKKKFGIKSLLAGMFLGSAFAMFFTPQKGKILRDKIAKERELGHGGVNAVAQGVSSFGKEIVRVTKNEIDSKTRKQKEHNPFTITKIYRYVDVV